VRLGALLGLYWQRVRTHPIQELLAGVGIAIGVALVFAVVVANTSISTSASEIVHGIAGNATLQMNARDEQGFDARLLAVVRSLPAVEHATGVLEQRVMLTGPRGRASVVLVGADASLAQLNGPVTRDFISGRGLTLGNALLVPRGTASSIGIASPAVASRQPTVVVQLRGRAQRVPVSAVLGSDVIGPLANAMVVVGPLSYVQRLAALPGRVTRVLVEPRPGQSAAARRELDAVAAGRITVAPVDSESRILAQASAPNDQSTELFAAISVIVGFLLAFNAMLLTVPERRRAIAELRTHGYTPRQIVQMAAFDALLLGTIAAAGGVLAGVILTRTVFGGIPTYLSFAFPLGASHTVSPAAVALAFVGGIAATFIAAGQPLLDLWSKRPPDAVYSEKDTEGEPGQALSTRAQWRLAATSAILMTSATVLVAAVPSTTVLGIAMLALATPMALPGLLALVVAGLERVSRRRPRLNMVVVAAMALRATRLRAIILAGTGAVAVFGSVAIEGAHRDLVRGLRQNFGEYLHTADLWVTTGGNDLTTENFRPDGVIARLRKVPGVRDVRPYYGGLLDVGSRRAWIIGRSSTDPAILPTGQIKSGDPVRAATLVRRGGAVAVSEQLAQSEHAHLGGIIKLPTPTGVRPFRVAALLTNLGWGPGAVILNSADYRRDWATSDPTALEVDLKPGVAPAAGKRGVEQAIGPSLALKVQTAGERAIQYDGLAREGLQRLTDISWLLLIAAAAALAAATGAALWQRRSSLADYRLQGFEPRQLWSAVVIESGVVLVTGCGTGAFVGLYGHFLLGRWLQLTTGFPAPFSPAFLAAFTTFGLVAATALIAVATPGYRAVRVVPAGELR